MVVKKRAKKKKDVDINIKVKGVDKLIKKKRKGGAKIKCYSWYKNCGGGGAGFGAALAMVLSYTRSESILWAIIHGILNWFYVIYRIIQVWIG